MDKTTLSFKENPSILPTLFQALTVKRPGLRGSNALPGLEVKLDSLKVDKDNLKKYCKLIGIEMSDTLPPLYPHVMVGVIHMHLLTHKDFPLKLMGTVHKYNTMKHKRPLKIDEEFKARCYFGELRSYEKGYEYDIHYTLESMGEEVWSETSTFFIRKKISNPSHSPSQFISDANCEEKIAKWKLSNMAGKNYAMICKDFNPIHISRPLAILFGFKRDIIHGFCSAAQALAKINPAHYQDKEIKFYFKGPSFMGSTMVLKKDSGNDQRYNIYCGQNTRPVTEIEFR